MNRYPHSALQGPLIVEEQLDRQILWICKHNPSLQDALDKPPGTKPEADAELVTESFEACKLGLRLVAFHVAFLKLIAKRAQTNFVQVRGLHSINSYSSSYIWGSYQHTKHGSAGGSLCTFSSQCLQHVRVLEISNCCPM